MDMMKTFVIEKDGSTHIKEVPKPKINSKQALVRLIANGMCGTDVKLLHHAFKGFPKSIYPIMLGHEGVGEIVEIGSDVRGYKVGDRVILPFVDPDEELYPGMGSGWGAMSEYGYVWDKDAVYAEGETIPDCAFAQTVLDPSLNPVDAIMLVTFREVLSTIRFFGIKPHESIVVFGCGPVGSSFIKFLGLLGVKDIIAVDIIDEKLEAAKEKGATCILNSQKCDIVAEIRKAFPQGVDYVLDAVGSPAIVNQAMPLIADRGKVLCYGVPASEQINLDFSKADYNFQVVYQQMPRKREEGEAHEQVMEWIKEGRLVIKDFISDYYKYEDSVQAYQDLLDRKIAKKGIIVSAYGEQFCDAF